MLDLDFIDYVFDKTINNELLDNSVRTRLDTILAKVLEALDFGTLRSVDKINNEWVTNVFVKKAILLMFKLNDKLTFTSNIGNWFDKIPLKQNSIKGFRSIPGGIIRKGVFIDPTAVICPAFINIGSFIDAKTMIDSFVTVGSCARIGKACHISEGVCIGGVLEPINANPVVIEDNCFIGAKSVIVDGIIVGKNSIIASSVTLTQSTKIIDRKSRQLIKGRIPENSLVVPGSYNVGDGLNIKCAVLMDKNNEIEFIDEYLRD